VLKKDLFTALYANILGQKKVLKKESDTNVNFATDACNKFISFFFESML